MLIERLSVCYRDSGNDVKNTIGILRAKLTTIGTIKNEYVGEKLCKK